MLALALLEAGSHCRVSGSRLGRSHHLSSSGSLSSGGGLGGSNLGCNLGSSRFRCGFKNSDNIIERNLGANDALGVLGKHDGYLDADDSLAHENVSNSGVGVDLAGMTSLDHVTVTELHGLGTLATELTSDNHLNTLGGGFHNETDDTVASTTDGEAAEELELEGLGLGLGTKTTVLDTLGVKLDSAISKVETLLDDRGKLTDTLSLLAKNVLGTGGTDDDLSTVGSGTDLNTGVAILGKLTSKKLVELRVEDAISDELPLGGHLRASGLHGGNCCCRKCRLRKPKGREK